MSRINFFLVLFHFIIILIKISSTNSSSSCNCINGDCIDNEYCKCWPCWYGSNCNQFIDKHEPYFSENIINLYLKKEIINHHDNNNNNNKPIYKIQAIDNDINNNCNNNNNNNCSCINNRYKIIEHQQQQQQDQQNIFEINSITGELYLKKYLNKNFLNKNYKLLIFVYNINTNDDKNIKNYFDKSSRLLTINIELELELERNKRQSPSSATSAETETNDDTIQSSSSSLLSKNNNDDDELELNGLHFGLRTLNGETNSLQVGNSIHYKLEIGLPKGSSEIILEVQTIDLPTSSNRKSLSLYNFSMPYETTDIQFNIPEPIFYLSNKTANVYDRLTLDFGTIKNNGPDRNIMTVCFSVILFRKPRKAKKKHSVIVGIEHTKGTITYVAESEITTTSVSSKDDQIFCDVDIVDEPKTIALDSTGIFRFDANFQFRSDHVRIELNKTSNEYEPDNIISLGMITATKFGINYLAMPNNLHHYIGYRNQSLSGKSFAQSILDMNMITNNGEKSRIFMKNLNNIISFKFPIYALNYEENIGKNISFNLNVFIAKRIYYTKNFTINIIRRNNNERIKSFLNETNGNFLQTTSSLTEGSIIQLKILSKFNYFNDENLFTNYIINILMNNNNNNRIPIIPCSARILSDENGINIPYVNPIISKPKIFNIDDNQLKYEFNFGRINFIRTFDNNYYNYSDNIIVTEITFRVPFDNSIIYGNYSIDTEQIQIISGYETKSISYITNNELNIISSNNININNETETLSLSSSSLIELTTNSSVQWSDLIVDAGIAVDIQLEFEPNAVFEDFHIEISSDLATAVDKLPDLKICRFAVITVDETMPCTCVERETINEKQIVYGFTGNNNNNNNNNKEMSKKEIINSKQSYYDKARIDFGSISVVNGSNVKQKILTNFAIMISDNNNNNNVENKEQQQQYPIRIDIISNSLTSNNNNNNIDGKENIIKSEQINLNISELIPEFIVSNMKIELDVELFNETDPFILPGFTTNILIRIITKPNTIGPLRIEVSGGGNNDNDFVDDNNNDKIKTNSSISICGLWIHRIGYNLPCIENNKKAEYAFETFGINRLAILQLDMITNFGNHHRKSKINERNDNSIEFMAMIKMLDDSANSNQTINIKAIYGHKDVVLMKKLIIPVGSKPNNNNDNYNDNDIIIQISQKKLIEPRMIMLKSNDQNNNNNNRLIYNRIPKLLYFDIDVEHNQQTQLSIEMERTNQYKMCNAAFIKIGENYPCYSPLSLMVKTNEFKLGMICNTKLNSKNNDENLLRLAFAILPTISTPTTTVNNDQFIISSTVFVGNELNKRPMEKKNELNFTIVSNDNDIINDDNDNFPINEGVHIIPIIKNDDENNFFDNVDNDESIVFKIRQRKWITFKLRIPVNSTGKLSVKIQGQTDENRAYIVLYDLRLINGGANIPCPLDNQPKIELNSTINSNQTNLIIADLGWFSNFAYTYYIDINNYGKYHNKSNDDNGNNINNDDADIITIEVLAELTDHPLLNENNLYQLEFEASYSNLTKTIKTNTNAKIKLLSERDEPNPKLDVNIRYNKRMPSLNRNETFTVMAMIKHLSDSNAEPSEPVLRMFTPKFVEIININWANTKSLPKLIKLSEGSTDILFPWILFNEEFIVNFTIQIDPNNIRGYGKNEMSIITPYRMMCKHFRVSINTKFPCSKMKHIQYRTHSTECYDPLEINDKNIINDDQITASTAIAKKFAPYFVRKNSTSWWSPVWHDWSNYQNQNQNDDEDTTFIQIDFRRKIRLVKIEFYSIKNQRHIDSYHLKYSFDGKIWYNGSNKINIFYNHNINDNDNDNNIDGIAESILTKPIEARLIRIIIDNVSKIDQLMEKYVAIKFELYGCFIRQSESSTRSISNESLEFHTHYTDDLNEKNRHVSIDPYTNIIYFCDATSNINNYLCYYSDSGGNQWQIIGRSIDTFEGFELATGKFFAINHQRSAYFYSIDGQQWIPINFKKFNITINHEKFQHKHIIPRFTSKDLNNLNIKIGNWKAIYQGLYYEDNQYPKAIWNKCCGFK